jgi:hypothetical protein
VNDELFSAIRFGNSSFVQKSVDNDLHVNARDDKGNTPVMVAIIYDNVDILNILLRNEKSKKFCETALKWIELVNYKQDYENFISRFQGIGCDTTEFVSDLKEPKIENLIKLLSLGDVETVKELSLDGGKLSDYGKTLVRQLNLDNVDHFLSLIQKEKGISDLFSTEYISFVFENHRNDPSYLQAAKKFSRSFSSFYKTLFYRKPYTVDHGEWLGFLVTIGFNIDGKERVSRSRNNYQPNPWGIKDFNESLENNAQENLSCMNMTHLFVQVAQKFYIVISNGFVSNAVRSYLKINISLNLN